MLRKLSLFFALGIFLIPTGVLAANVAPEFNPICWKEEECLKKRKEFLAPFGDNLTPEERKSMSEGFLLGEAPCPAPWGKCLPATIARTQIRFGGENRFADIGQFLFKNYNLAISLAGIVASIVVVIAGFQWAMSGGNADTIGKAKKRIGGAIVGLLIAYTSYVILHTINPDLVNLRLPQAYMIKPQNVMPKFCSQAPRSSMFHKVAESNDQQPTIDTTVSFPEYELEYDEVADIRFTNGTNCGARYVVKDGGALTCFGDVCQGNQVCMNMNFTDPNDTKYHCEDASVYGEIVGNYLITPFCGLKEGYEFPYLLDEYKDRGISTIHRICQDAVHTVYEKLSNAPSLTIGGKNAAKQTMTFKLSSIGDLGQGNEICELGRKFLGYGLILDLNGNCWPDTTHLISKTGEDLGIISSGNFILDRPNRTPTQNDFYTAEELKKGQRILMDVSTFVQK